MIKNLCINVTREDPEPDEKEIDQEQQTDFWNNMTEEEKQAALEAYKEINEATATEENVKDIFNDECNSEDQMDMI